MYQRAQIKTYQTLGRLFGETLKTLRPANRSQARVGAEPWRWSGLRAG